MTDYIPILAVAMAFALTGTPVARLLALRLGVLDQPSKRKVHTVPTPLLGGLAIYLAFLIAVFMLWDTGNLNQVVGIVTAATLLAMLGFLDDGGKLHPQVKLVVGMPIAALILIVSGVQAAIIHQPILDLGLTMLWVVGMTAAFNLLDNMDGLSAGVAAVASFFFLWLAASSGQYLVGGLAAAVLGASLGFLRYNFNPARIFMGDGGALFLGFMMAVLGLKINFPLQTESTSWIIPILVLGVPILDTSLVTVSRLRRGLNPMATPGKDHLSHRLVKLGLSPRWSVSVIYIVGILLGLFAVIVSQAREPLVAIAIAICVSASGVIAIILLEKVKFDANP